MTTVLTAVFNIISIFDGLGYVFPHDHSEATTFAWLHTRTVVGLYIILAWYIL